MATITTTTQTDVLAQPVTPAIARVASGSLAGRQYCMVRTATDTLTVYVSTNNGGSWTSHSSFTNTTLQEWSSLVVDNYGYGHVAFRTSSATPSDLLAYRRCDLASGTWGSAVIMTNDANAGTPGSRWQGLDLAVARTSSGTYYIATCAAYTQDTTRYGMVAHGIVITSAGQATLKNSIFGNNRSWYINGTAPGRAGVACEVEHTGDGYTSATPHVWAAWGRQKLQLVKLAWNGSGWTTPLTALTIKSPIPDIGYTGGRWDGTQWVMSIFNPDNTSSVRLYQRNQANTVSTAFDTPTHPTGVIRQFAHSYDAISKDIRVYAIGTSTAVLYYIDWTRATSTWSSWATVTASAILGPAEWTVRRGGTSSNARFDVAYAVSGAPNTISNIQQTASNVPYIAAWDTSTVPYVNGGAAESAAALVLDWTFTDPDTSDVQGSYALQRQIGSGVLQYYTAAGGTWGAVEVQNTSATTSVTLASAWSVHTDAAYTFKVKVWDNGGVPAPGYSAGLVLTPSLKVNPSIVTPTAAQVLATDQVTMTWTAAEQIAYRVRLLTNPGGVVLHDSGFISGADLTYTDPTTLDNASGFTIELTTQNNEGLASTAQTRNFTTAYFSPPAVTPALTPVPASGWVQVTSVALTAVGSQPAINSMDLYRRVAATPNLGTNSTMTGNVTGWTNVGGTLTFSTTQAHEGTGAARLVPTGAAADSQVSAATGSYATYTAGSGYTAGAWVRPDTALKSIKIQINFYDSGNSLLGSVTKTYASVVAAAWHYVEVTGDAALLTGVAKVGAAVGLTGTPAASDAFYADEITWEIAGSDPGVRIATQLVHPATVLDWQAVGNTALEYRWVTTGSTGTTVAGPWTT